MQKGFLVPIHRQVFRLTQVMPEWLAKRHYPAVPVWSRSAVGWRQQVGDAGGSRRIADLVQQLGQLCRAPFARIAFHPFRC